jgi:hypothetical protein
MKASVHYESEIPAAKFASKSIAETILLTYGRETEYIIEKVGRMT